MKSARALAAPNVIPLDVPNRNNLPRPGEKQRFKILPYDNRNGVRSWRVTGSKRDGTRIRENFKEKPAAQCRQIELETEYLRGHAETTIRATKLSAEQIQLCEVAMIKLGDDWQRILDAVDWWKQHGKHKAVADSPRVDEAVEKYLAWLEASPFRDATKRHWKYRMGVFKNSVPNLRVADFTPELIEEFLSKQNVTAVGKDTYRRAVSRFFSWCIERPQRWTTSNPCREVRVTRPEDEAPPAILTMSECADLLRAAVDYQNGKLVPYLAVCLFGGVRPTEAARLEWCQVNLADAELRLEANQTKMGRKQRRGRVMTINATLLAWLKEYKGQPFSPPNWRKGFDAVKRAAGFGTPTKDHPDLKPWPDDVLRHTAISHFFRATGSYGLAAEQFGNSEAIIKKHYQGRVSTTETEKFYQLTPAIVKKGLDQ
jgi:integrase